MNKKICHTWLRNGALAHGSIKEGIVEKTVSEPFVNRGVVSVVHARQVGVSEADQAAADTYENTS